MADDRAEWEGKSFVSEPFSCLPPLATTSCIIEDRGKDELIHVGLCHLKEKCLHFYCKPISFC